MSTVQHCRCTDRCASRTASRPLTTQSSLHVRPTTTGTTGSRQPIRSEFSGYEAGSSLPDASNGKLGVSRDDGRCHLSPPGTEDLHPDGVSLCGVRAFTPNDLSSSECYLDNHRGVFTTSKCCSC